MACSKCDTTTIAGEFEHNEKETCPVCLYTAKDIRQDPSRTRYMLFLPCGHGPFCNGC